MPYNTLGEMFNDQVRRSPTSPAFRRKVGGTWEDVPYSTLGERMQAVASGMLTAGPELADDAAVAILGNTSADWITVDYGCLSIGLQTVPVYATLLPAEVGYLCADTQAVIMVVENADQLAKVREMRQGFTFFDEEYGPERINVQHIVVIDPTDCDGDDWESLADLEARGKARLEETQSERERRAAKPKRDDVATYTYTSGTTGPPKGVVQTHGNMLAMIEAVDASGLFGGDMRSGGFFLFLPLAHSFGRLIELSGPYFDAPIVISSVPTIADDLKETRPGFFPSAPRVYEKMKARVEAKVAGAPPFRQKMFHWAIGVGKQTIPYRSRGEAIPFGLNMQLAVAEKLVLSKLRAAMGFDRADVLLSGSAPLNVTVHEFFMAMGANLFEAYGLTETCPGLTTNLPGRFKLGTVGVAFPGVELRIADDGEILAKGPNITSGYLNRADATEGAFEDGWFLTGDLGSLDDEGFLKITGRKKELMKTSGGKYVVPAKLEAKLKDLSFVQEAVSVADQRNYVTALIALDPEELQEWSEQTGNAADDQSDEVRAAIQAHVDQVNESLASYETIKYFTVVPPMTVESGILTASLKVKRKVVLERYEAEIEAMYNKRKPS